MIRIVLASAMFLTLNFTMKVKISENTTLLVTMVFPIWLVKPVTAVISNKWFYIKNSYGK